MKQKFLSGEFFCYRWQNTGAGYWPKRPVFANCNFSDFFSVQIINASQPFWFIA